MYYHIKNAGADVGKFFCTSAFFCAKLITEYREQSRIRYGKTGKSREKGKTMEDRGSNYEKVYAQFQDWFVQCPQEDVMKKVGGDFDREYAYLPFFGERCRILRKTGEITGEEERELPVTERLTIMHHLRYCKSFAEENGRMVPFREIREAAVFERAYEKAALEPLKRYFAGRPGRLLEAGLKMGGVREGYGDVSVTLYPFPKIRLTYIFWDGDEEFPPSANILFQDSIARWTHPESVPTLAQIGTERLIQAAEK